MGGHSPTLIANDCGGGGMGEEGGAEDEKFPGKHSSRRPGLLINSDTSVAQSVGRLFLENRALPLETWLVPNLHPKRSPSSPFSFYRLLCLGMEVLKQRLRVCHPQQAMLRINYVMRYLLPIPTTTSLIQLCSVGCWTGAEYKSERCQGNEEEKQSFLPAVTL